MLPRRLRVAAVLLAFASISCAQGSDETDVGHRGGQKIGPGSGSASSPSSGASCLDHCGGSSEDGSCWCDPECGVSGSCCADFVSACSNEPNGSGGSPSTGGSGSTAGTGGSGAMGGSAAGGSGGYGAGGSGATGGTSGFGGTGATGGTGVGGAGGAPGSCYGKCGGPADGGACWCDSTCSQSGDCCADYASACGGGVGGAGGAPSSGGCTPQLCGTSQPGTENGQACYCDPQCFVYGDCCTNILLVCGF